MSIIRFTTTTAFAGLLLLGACSSSSSDDDAGLPIDDSAADCVDGVDCDDTGGGAAGACLAGEPDCEDDPSSSGGAVSSGALADGGLDVETAMSKTPADGIVAVTGVLFIDENGTFLCGALAESLPPQCASGALEIAGLDLDALAAPLQEADSVRWSDTSIILFGTVDQGVLTVDPTVN